jgi:hypothetical protein
MASVGMVDAGPGVDAKRVWEPAVAPTPRLLRNIVNSI